MNPTDPPMPRIKAALDRVSTPQPEPAAGDIAVVLPRATADRIASTWTDDTTTDQTAVAFACRHALLSEVWTVERPGAAAEEAPPEPRPEPFAEGDAVRVIASESETNAPYEPGDEFVIAQVFTADPNDPEDCHHYRSPDGWSFVHDWIELAPAAASPEPARPEWLELKRYFVGHPARTVLPIASWYCPIMGEPVEWPQVAREDGIAGVATLVPGEWVPASPPSPDTELDADLTPFNYCRTQTSHALIPETGRCFCGEFPLAPVAAPVDEPEPAACVWCAHPADDHLKGCSHCDCSAVRHLHRAAAAELPPDRPAAELPEWVELLHPQPGWPVGSVHRVVGWWSGAEPDGDHPEIAQHPATRGRLPIRLLSYEWRAAGAPAPSPVPERPTIVVGPSGGTGMFSPFDAETVDGEMIGEGWTIGDDEVERAAAGSPEPGDDGTRAVMLDRHDAAYWQHRFAGARLNDVEHRLSIACRAALGEDR